MKIKKIKLTNFQSYENTELVLSDNVNVFVGVSRQGKTAIIRALQWVLDDQLKGDYFISYGKKNCSVEIETFKGDVITRTRTPSFNGYYLNGTKFEALRGKIPDEIKNIVGMTDLNWQFEHDGPFLLNDSPGEVARKLNKVADLEDIDISFKNLNHWVKSTNNDVDRFKNECDNLESDLKEYDYLPKMKKEVDQLEKQEEELGSIEEQITSLKKICKDLHYVKDMIYYNNKKLKIKEELDFIFEQEQELENEGKKIHELGKAIQTLSEIKGKYSSEYIQAVKTGSAELEEVLEKERSIERMKDVVDNLSRLLRKAEHIKKEKSECLQRINQLKKQMPEQCPECGTYLYNQ